jgi:Fur family ferric uptake transcriptional regulator
MALVEAGLVARTDLGDRMWRFELRGDRARHEKKHPHLVCTDCGRVECLADVEVQVKVVRGARRGLRTEDMEIQLRGRCEKCAA